MGAVVFMGEMLSDGSWEAKETKFFPSKPGGAGAIIWPPAACCWVGAPPVFGVGRAWVVVGVAAAFALICSSMGGFISLGPLPESVLRSCFSRAFWLFSPGAWIAAAGGCPPPGFWELVTRSGLKYIFLMFFFSKLTAFPSGHEKDVSWTSHVLTIDGASKFEGLSQLEILSVLPPGHILDQVFIPLFKSKAVNRSWPPK